jgi:hypothetical protein
VLQFTISGSDQIAGEGLTFQVNDGTSGPRIAAIDIFTGTIFASNNTGQSGAGIVTTGPYAQRLAVFSTTTLSGSVLDNGLLATVTLDTSGFTGSSFELRLLGTLNGDSLLVRPDASLVTPVVADSRFAAVPVPLPAAAWTGLAMLSLLAGATLLSQRRATA